MQARVPDWVRLPTKWINDCGLKQFKWERDKGADNLAALMTLIAIAHRVDENGLCKITYDHIEAVTTLSRAKISKGLSVLSTQGIISRQVEGRSTFKLSGYGFNSWGKLPARGLYTQNSISLFRDFNLRRPAELHSIKLYLLFIARRDNSTNLANISYDKITEYTGIERQHIRQSLSYLTLHGLVHIERGRSSTSELGIANSYRLAFLDPYNHGGTKGRSDIDSADSINGIF